LNSSAEDSDVALSARAISLKNLGDNQRALNAFQLLFDKNQSPFTAYEVADLKILTGNTEAAMEDVEFGLANASDEMNYAFFERQQPYQVPLKAAFMHLKALITFNGKNENIEEAVAIFDEALKMAPNFNLASLSRGALLERKEQNQAQQ
jgi:tetratricopeptide (TPR) repeat protein